MPTWKNPVFIAKYLHMHIKDISDLLEEHKISKSNVITICDFSQSSRNRRLYVVDLETRKILINTYVAHGRRSGGEYAKSFSNKWSSHKSSLGFYVTEMTYTGKHGLCDENSWTWKKDLMIRPTEGISLYMVPNMSEKNFCKSNKFNGRSFGCPAIPNADVKEVIEDMKGGSCFFIYHPTKKYLTGFKNTKRLTGRKLRWFEGEKVQFRFVPYDWAFLFNS